MHDLWTYAAESLGWALVLTLAGSAVGGWARQQRSQQPSTRGRR